MAETLLTGLALDETGVMMQMGVLLLLVHAAHCFLAVPAQEYPPTIPYHTPSPAIRAHASLELPPPSNISLILASGYSGTRILCFKAAEGRETTSIDGCRLTLNRIRRLPNYRLKQDFQEGRNPKDPFKPPYIFHEEGSDCAIQLASGSETIVDKFSFEQVRSLATDILEDCQAFGGYGGVAFVS